jgi:alcohol dehydrogenase (cytochrome c)
MRELAGVIALCIVHAAGAQTDELTPVTSSMLQQPPAADWLMFSRTYDAQRFSPLAQINRSNVRKLTMAWSRQLAPYGVAETVPLVHDGVMYVAAPGAIVLALNAETGDVLWEYRREVADNVAASARTKALAIYEDVIIYTAPDSFVVGLDTRTGRLRWESKADTRGHTSGVLVVDGKAISGGACFGNRDNCYIAAHDALTGRELWRFYTTPAPGEPGDETWSGAALNNRQASTWGFPGSFDPDSGLVFWGIANPMPDHRAARHGDDPAGTARTSPADLYSNSTVALNPATGQLVWYYQHLPGDDWDLDATHERTLLRTPVAPDPELVKWINPALEPGETRNVVMTLPEGGGIWALDRDTGEFLWATPFPFDVPQFAISTIEPATGRVHINWDLVFKAPGDHHVVCFWNTRSYWPTAYSPETNSLYTSYIDNCRELTAADARQPEQWRAIARPGSDSDALTGLAKINVATGEIMRFDVGSAPGNGALLATAGGLVFHGDMSRRFRAFDAESGARLWETILGGNVSVSTITYAVDGRQYVAVMTGNNLKVPELSQVVPQLETPPEHNAIYVFGLPPTPSHAAR